MEIHYKYLLKLKLHYLKLASKISKIGYRGNEPPKELVKQAYDLGRLAGISEVELKNI